jgi:KDO2-lipid IV(A) lauroyltransferase
MSSGARRWKNDVIYLAAAAGVRVGLRMPRWALPSVGSILGSISYVIFARARRMAAHNLARVYPGLSRAERTSMSRRTFRCLGRALTDTLALLDRHEDPCRTLHLSVESASALHAALAGGRGVIFVTAHLGPWERMAALLAKRGFPITTVARESYDPRFHPLIYDRLRPTRGVVPIYRGAPGSAAALVRALRAGRVVGFLMDLPGRFPARPVALLGQSSRAPLGPARLALRLRVPVVVGTPLPGASDGMPVIHIAPLSTADLGTGDHDEAELTQRMADALSDRIRAWPTAWPWMHPSFEPIASP